MDNLESTVRVLADLREEVAQLKARMDKARADALAAVERDYAHVSDRLHQRQQELAARTREESPEQTYRVKRVCETCDAQNLGVDMCDARNCHGQDEPPSGWRPASFLTPVSPLPVTELRAPGQRPCVTIAHIMGRLREAMAVCRRVQEPMEANDPAYGYLGEIDDILGTLLACYVPSVCEVYLPRAADILNRVKATIGRRSPGAIFSSADILDLLTEAEEVARPASAASATCPSWCEIDCQAQSGAGCPIAEGNEVGRKHAEQGDRPTLYQHYGGAVDL